MNLLERDGYKEKRATLVASRIYPIGKGNTTTSSFTDNQGYPTPVEAPSNVVDFASTMQTPSASVSSNPAPAIATPESAASSSDSSEDWDEIPF